MPSSELFSSLWSPEERHPLCKEASVDHQKIWHNAPPVCLVSASAKTDALWCLLPAACHPSLVFDITKGLFPTGVCCITQ